jgi:hypothetical protein
MGLAVRYFLKAEPKKLFANASFGLNMMKLGRISVTPKSIKKIKEIRAIIDKAKELEGKK